MIRPFFSPQYYAQRGTFLLDISERKINHVIEVRVTFSPPDHGWIEMSIYIDGLKACEITWSDVYDPSEDIRDWLTDIITEWNPNARLFIDEEGSNGILTFEEYGLDGSGDECISLGLFTVYETWDDSMPVKVIVSKRQLVSAIYLGLLSYAATFTFDNMYSSFSYHWDFHCCNGNEYYEDVEDEENEEYISKGQWTFYNNIKSPKLEWYLYEDYPGNSDCPDFSIKGERIKDYVFMCTEWGEGLFWQGREHCCGNVDKLKLDDLEIDLSDIKGLREWQEEYQTKREGEKWDSKKQRDWQRRGRGFAFEIRKRLPANIELYFNWLRFKHDDAELPNVMSLIPNLPIHTFVPLEWR